MTAETKRFTISLSQNLGDDLDAAKKKYYCKDTESAMIRDLICRGLAASKTKSGVKE